MGGVRRSEWAWDIFQTVEEKCKVEAGYAEYPNVNMKQIDKLNDVVHSYFGAKTLKYFYLLINPERLVDIDTTIVTSGGHILTVLDE